jgi:hypothetical protein
MPLTRLEHEVITDSMLKIQSIQASLAHIDEVKLPDIVEINTCLAAANNSFREVLRASPAGKDPK